TRCLSDWSSDVCSSDLFGHEGGVHLVAQRRLARGAFEEKHLIRQVERLAVDQVDLHLRRTVLMDEGVDLDILVLAELVDVIEQRSEERRVGKGGRGG